MSILISVVLPLALAVIMLSLGLGLTVADFRRVAVQPKAFFTGAASQLVLVPLVAYAVCLLFALPPELAVGVMILSFCPGGVTSNLMSRLADGDVALSVSLTAVVSLLSMFTVPLLVAWAIATFMGADAPPVSIGTLAFSMFLITALPVLIGVATRHFAPAFVQRLEPILSKIAVALFVIIVVAALAANWSLFVDNLARLGPALIGLNIVLMAAGFALAAGLGLSSRERATVSIETGVQNSTVGITLATIVVAGTAAASADGGFPAYALPSAVYGITMYAVTLPAIAFLRRRRQEVSA